MASRRKPSKVRKPKSGAARAARSDSEAVPEMSRAEIRELERRVKDLEDRTRYVLISQIGSKVVLYYNLSEDTYSWNDPKDTTLFKRREAALKIQAMLGTGIKIAKCRVSKQGHLVRNSVVFHAKSKRSEKKLGG
jgi:hypothetical protein